jgi:mono/diheme cytochrome c family protein
MRKASISCIALLLAGGASLAWSADTEDKIWNGVFTAAQVERGKADFEKSCSNCHVSDLSGSVRAPALRGQRFMQNWQNGSVGVLFTKIRDSMPANYPETVPEDVKLNILTFLLNQNGFPAGSTELKLDDKELADIQIVQKGNQAAANFAMVRIVGCLTQGPGKTWTLTKSTEPTVVKEETATPAALQAAADIPLGTQTFELVSVTAFKPEARQGQKVEARGLLYREASHNLLNLTSLERAGSGCD